MSNRAGGASGAEWSVIPPLFEEIGALAELFKKVEMLHRQLLHRFLAVLKGVVECAGSQLQAMPNPDVAFLLKSKVEVNVFGLHANLSPCERCYPLAIILIISRRRARVNEKSTVASPNPR